MSGWGVQVRGNVLDAEPKCWRCQESSVPDEDELGLCDVCIADLQDSSRSSRSRRSQSAYLDPLVPRLLNCKRIRNRGRTDS
jgi:hypothetical protein